MKKSTVIYSSILGRFAILSVPLETSTPPQWTVAGCKNTLPLAFKRGDRPEYASQLECCKMAYGGQTSQACIQGLAVPPTSSPTMAGGLDVWYRDTSKPWTEGTCTNAYPFPNNVGDISTQAKTKEGCCKQVYVGQVSDACMCDVDPCHSCNCPGAAGCSSLTCS